MELSTLRYNVSMLHLLASQRRRFLTCIEDGLAGGAHRTPHAYIFALAKFKLSKSGVLLLADRTLISVKEHKDCFLIKSIFLQ